MLVLHLSLSASKGLSISSGQKRQWQGQELGQACPPFLPPSFPPSVSLLSPSLPAPMLPAVWDREPRVTPCQPSVK
jgi:hypothetical protein